MRAWDFSYWRFKIHLINFYDADHVNLGMIPFRVILKPGVDNIIKL